MNRGGRISIFSLVEREPGTYSSWPNDKATRSRSEAEHTIWRWPKKCLRAIGQVSSSYKMNRSLENMADVLRTRLIPQGRQTDQTACHMRPIEPKEWSWPEKRVSPNLKVTEMETCWLVLLTPVLDNVTDPSAILLIGASLRGFYWFFPLKEAPLSASLPQSVTHCACRGPHETWAAYVSSQETASENTIIRIAGSTSRKSSVPRASAKAGTATSQSQSSLRTIG